MVETDCMLYAVQPWGANTGTAILTNVVGTFNHVIYILLYSSLVQKLKTLA